MEGQKNRRCDDGSTGFIFLAFSLSPRARQAIQAHTSAAALPRVIQGRHARRVVCCLCGSSAHNALGLRRCIAASLPPPHGEARNVAAPRIGTPSPRSRMMVLGRAAKVKGHGELAGPGTGYSRVAADLRSVCLPLVPWQASREPYVPSSCCFAVPVLCAVCAVLCSGCMYTLLGPSHHDLAPM